MVRLGHEKSRQRAGVGAAQRVGRRPGKRKDIRRRRWPPFWACMHNTGQPLGVYGAGARSRRAQGQADTGPARASSPPAKRRRCSGWVTKLPTSFGFPTGLWTSRRLGGAGRAASGASASTATIWWQWLHAREHTPQKPEQPAQRTRRGRHRTLERAGLATPAKKARAGKRSPRADRRERLLSLVRWCAGPWAPQGKTPILPSWGRHRDKVSVIAALRVAPDPAPAGSLLAG